MVSFGRSPKTSDGLYYFLKPIFYYDIFILFLPQFLNQTTEFYIIEEHFFLIKKSVLVFAFTSESNSFIYLSFQTIILNFGMLWQTFSLKLISNTYIYVYIMHKYI